MRGLQRKPPPPPSPPVAVGYINLTRLDPGSNVAEVGARMRHRAEQWGYAWGGTYVDRHTASSDTLEALIRRTARDLGIWAIVVPDDAHLQAGRAVLCTGTTFVRVVAVGSTDGANHRPPQQIPTYP
ncbi:hypothetical protein ACFYT3_09825 [Nocardia amikacinitolerans]|uniref:hypothetical protein n=1 Tax=Nocardia amikacinitolerans TaxID=756689 RepID=UPI00368D7F82